MTAEIAILNKSAIALAADSAVTITPGTGQIKIYNSVNKLFALSKYQPVGVMVYGNAELMGVPWETTIKIYREFLGKKRLSTLKDYADDFIKFLNNNKSLFPEEIQIDQVKTKAVLFFSIIRETILSTCEKELKGQEPVDENKVREIIAATIQQHYEAVNKYKRLPSLPDNFEKTLQQLYLQATTEAANQIFGEGTLQPAQISKLNETVSLLFATELFPDYGNSGVVIAGFGENETFPSLVSFKCEAVVANKLKYIQERHSTITFKNKAWIIPFAQKEMVQTFMEGCDPNYHACVIEALQNVMSKYVDGLIAEVKEDKKPELSIKLKKLESEIVKGMLEDLKKYRQKNHVEMIVSAVESLPKDELAAMAESLVSLTVFKRKVSMSEETVGGPIDVAVISKGDGFIWIKRKHYFQPELNPHFLAKYYDEQVKGKGNAKS